MGKIRLRSKSKSCFQIEIIFLSSTKKASTMWGLFLWLRLHSATSIILLLLTVAEALEDTYG